MRLTLNSVPNTRKTLARLLRARHSGEIDREVFRDLCYGFQTFLQVYRLETDLRLEERLDKIEKILRGEQDD